MLSLGLGAGALLYSTDGRSQAQAPTAQTITESVAFYAAAGDSDASVLNLGGLTVSAYCRDHGGDVDRPYLSVGARTALDNSTIGASFTQRKGGEQAAYSFGLSDFDRDYGAWDFLGTNPINTVGSLVFSRPDGGRMTLTFRADRGTVQGECAFAGTATYAPTTQTQPSRARGSAQPTEEFAVRRSYLGVSCPQPNSIACDRVGLYVWAEAAPSRLIATLAGHQFELERVHHGGGASYEGFLQAHGLLHDGPLAVEASPDDRWLGDLQSMRPSSFKRHSRAAPRRHPCTLTSPSVRDMAEHQPRLTCLAESAPDCLAESECEHVRPRQQTNWIP